MSRVAAQSRPGTPLAAVLVVLALLGGGPLPAAAPRDGLTPASLATIGGGTTWVVGPGDGANAPCDPAGVDFTTGQVGDGSDDAAIQAAVNAATTGDTVLLCDHRYDLTTGITPGTSVATALTLRGESTTGTEVSGGGVQLFGFATPSRTLDLAVVGLTLSGGSATTGGAVQAGRVTVQGAVFRANTATGTVDGTSGGGAISATSVAVTDGTFLDNSAATCAIGIEFGCKGGAIYSTGPITLDHATFVGNRADVDGGAIYGSSPGASLTSAGSLFEGNGAVNYGGGAAFIVGPVSLTDDRFVGNAASWDGGAVVATGNVTVFRTEFSGNTATGTWLVGGGVPDYFGRGGAIYTDGALSLSEATFVANKGQWGGALWSMGTLAISRSSFVGNRADGDGGAIRSVGAVTSASSTYLENTAGSVTVDQRGGAIFGQVSVTSVGDTFARNQAPQSGGAIFAESAYFSGDSLVATGSDFTANTAGLVGGATWGLKTTISGSTFVDNRAGTEGGAVRGTATTIGNSTFRGNSSGTVAGAIRSLGAVVSTANAYLENTSGTNGADHRGGVLFASGAVTSAYDRFAGNLATNTYWVVSRGGAILGEQPITVSHGTFVDNAAGNGGAISGYRNITITDSSFSANRTLTGGPNGLGGAVHLDATGNTLLAVLRSDFTANTSPHQGGALATINGARISVTDSTFIANSAVKGGAINGSGLITSTRSDYSANTANSGGGAIFANAGISVAVLGGTFIGNSSYGGSGAIETSLGYPSNTVISVTDATFIENVCQNGDGGALNADYVVSVRSTYLRNRTGYYGGAIKGRSSVTVTEGSFVGNLTAGSGTGAAIDSSTIRVTDVSFVDNSAGTSGGALRGGTVTSERSLYRDNRAAAGGAITASSQVYSWNDTFAGNRATGNGGAVNIGGQSGNAGVRYATFVDNTAGNGSHLYRGAGTAVPVTASLFVGGDCTGATSVGASFTTVASCPGVLVTRADLRLGELTSGTNGLGTFPLEAGSPAIDPTAGSLAACDWSGGTTTRDALGQARPSLHGCDSGASEFQGPTDRTTETSVSASSGDLVLTGGTRVRTGALVSLTAQVFSSGLEVTGGVVRFFYCRSSVAMPTDCSAGTAGRTMIGSDQPVAIGTPGDDVVSASISAWQPATGYFYRVAAGYFFGGGVIRGSDTTSGQTTFAMVDYTTATVLTGRSGGIDLTAGVELVPGSPVTFDARVTSGDLTPVRIGSMAVRGCRNDTAVPASCTDGTWTEITAGVAVVDGSAGVIAWSVPVAGFYRIVASYSSGDPGVLRSDATTGVTFRALRPVSLLWDATTGATVLAANTAPLLRVRVLRAGTTDPTSGCAVRFAISDGTSLWVADGTSGVDGYAQATAPAALGANVYRVTMTVRGACVSAVPAWGVLSVGPTSGFAKGTTGVLAGGWYLRDGTSGSRIAFGIRVDATSATFRSRTVVTVTTTNIRVVIVSDAGWLLETRTTDVNNSALAQTIPWLKEACPASLSDGSTPAIATPSGYVCGRLITTAANLLEWSSGSWRASAQATGPVSYRIQLADAGTVRTGEPPTDWISLFRVLNANGTIATPSPAFTSAALRPLRGGTGYATNPSRGSVLIL